MFFIQSILALNDVEINIYFCELYRFQTPGLDVNQILDIPEEEEILDVEDIYLQPPAGDESDGYDELDTQEGQSGLISRTILQVKTDNVQHDISIMLCVS